MKRLLPALALLLAAPPACAAEVGRLFFTPAQRSSLDTARAQRVRTAVATEPSATEAPPKPPSPEVVTYGGVVRRSDGNTTVWLNNRAITGKEAAGAPLVRGVRPDGSVTLHGAQGGRDVSLRVGQRAELLSGTVEEGYLRGPAPGPDAAPTGLKGKPEAAPAAKPAADATAASTERARADREQREQLDDAIRALKEAAAAKPAAPPASPPGPPER